MQLVEQRRLAREQELWSIPAISIAAQAFLFTTGLAADTSPSARLILGVIGFLTALGTGIAVLRQARHVSIADDWMEECGAPTVWQLKQQLTTKRAKRHRLRLLDHVSEWILGPPNRWQISNGYIWGAVLFAFGVADLLVIFSSIGGIHLLNLAK